MILPTGFLALALSAGAAELPTTSTEAIKASSAERTEAAVVSVTEGRATLAQGRSHGVRPGDLYRLVSRTGFALRRLEIDSVEEAGSSGRSYLSLADRLWNESALPQVGDTARFLGPRRKWRWGARLGIRGSGAEGSGDAGPGGGLVFDYALVSDWSVEGLVGAYWTSQEDHQSYPGNVEASLQRSMQIIAPVWVKKDFRRFSRWSPFAGIGAAYYIAKSRALKTDPSLLAEERISNSGITPFFGAGLDVALDPRWSLRYDMRYVHGPRLGRLRTSSVLFSLALLTDL